MLLEPSVLQLYHLDVLRQLLNLLRLQRIKFLAVVVIKINYIQLNI